MKALVLNIINQERETQSDSPDVAALWNVFFPELQAGPAEVHLAGPADHVVAASVLLYGGPTLGETIVVSSE